MKTKILTAALVLFTIVLTAQEQEKRIQFGVRSGLNISSVVGEDEDFESPDARFSFYGGLVVEGKINDRFSVLSEVFYSRQGFELGESFDDDEFDPQLQVDYIQVPLMLKVNIFEGLSAHAGPQFGFKISEEYDTDILDNGGDTDTDFFKDFDLQITTGVQYSFKIGLFVQARYTYGISELRDNTEIHNSVFSTGVGFMF